MPSILTYTEDGRESVNSNKLPLLAKYKYVTNSSYTNTGNRMFPLNSANPNTNPIKVGNYLHPPYKTRALENEGLVFMKPTNIANGIFAFGAYATTFVNSQYCVTDLTGNGDFRGDIIIAGVDTVDRGSGFIRVHADDANNTLIWSLDTFKCGVNVLAVVPFTQMLHIFDIPSWVDKNHLYVNVPHMLVFDRDNGTDPTYSASSVAYQIIGDKAYVRCYAANQNGPTASPGPGGWIVLAYIPNALSTTTVTS